MFFYWPSFAPVPLPGPSSRGALLGFSCSGATPTARAMAVSASFASALTALAVLAISTATIINITINEIVDTITKVLPLIVIVICDASMCNILFLIDLSSHDPLCQTELAFSPAVPAGRKIGRPCLSAAARLRGSGVRSRPRRPLSSRTGRRRGGSRWRRRGREPARLATKRLYCVPPITPMLLPSKRVPLLRAAFAAHALEATEPLGT